MQEVQRSGRVRKDLEESVRKLQQGPSLGSMDTLIKCKKKASSTYIYTEITCYFAQTNRSVRTDSRLLIVCGLSEMPQKLAIDHHLILQNDRPWLYSVNTLFIDVWPRQIISG